MVGIIGGGLASSVSVDAQGLDAIPSPRGEFASSSIAETFLESPMTRLSYEGGEMMNRGIAVDDLGRPMDVGPGAPTLDPSSANEKYGIPGVLNFTHPITDAGAQALYDAKRAQAVRRDTINRKADSLLTGQVAQLGYGLIGGLLDPINLAAGLVPGVGEARVASLLGETALARVGARAVAGASAGAAGAVALEPLNYALDQSQGEDWTMSQALRNVAFGTAFGGGLHIGLGAAGDAIARRRAAGQAADVATIPTNPIAARIDALDPEAREQVFRGALAQHVEGDPVNVSGAVDASETARYLDLARQDPRLSEWTQLRDDAAYRLLERQAGLDDFTAARDARNRGEAPAALADYGSPAAVDAALRGREQGAAGLRGRIALADYVLDRLRAGEEPGLQMRYPDAELNRPAGVDAPGDAPQSMLSRIRELGGLQDSGGELAARDLHRTPGMVRAGGMPLERAAVRMAEEGYLPELSRDMAGSGVEDVDRIGAMLDAIDEQRSGRTRIREQDAPAWGALMQRHEAALGNLREVADRLGITEKEARGLSRGHVQDLLQRRVEPVDDPFEIPEWDDLPTPRDPAALRRDMATSTEAMRSPSTDPAVMADDRASGEVQARAPKVEAVEPDAQLAEAQAAADAMIARVQTEIAAGRLPEGAMTALTDATKAAEGEAKAHEAAAACLATRMI